MNLFAHIRTLVGETLGALADEGALPRGLDLAGVTVEPPRDPAHGDMATNAAMVLAKQAGRKPREIAEMLAPRLAADNRVAEATVAGPGFINMRLDPRVWRLVIPAAIREGDWFGYSRMGLGQRVNVEYVSANPTGPLHVGHTRGAVFGDALAKLLMFTGHEVTREYYVNDAGAQVDTLARSVYLRYREALGEAVTIPEGLYPGDYLVEVGRALADLRGDALADLPEASWLPDVREFAIEKMMEIIRDDLAALGVSMDLYFSERSLTNTGQIEAALRLLEEKGLIYEGVLEPPKGKTPEDWEPRPQTLFKATDFGDDTDRPLRKSDGSWTYFAPDIAYHHDKIERGFDHLINVFGADHGGYVKRLTAAVKALSGGRVDLDVKLCQLVRLYKDGEPYKMSKRAGTFVTLRDLIDEVGADVTRFVMLTRRNDAPLDFDFARALEQSRENPVWYVQYAHARICSAVAKSAEALGSPPGDSALADAPLDLLDDPDELALLRKVGEFPRLVELAASQHEPHRIAFYLYDLASEFHAHWNRGQDRPALRLIRADAPDLTRARMALARAVAVVISAGLGILGVTPLRELK
jgi:arginyl-tRNA synthetase